MAVTIRCQCSRVLMVSEELAGQPTRCPSCGRRHIVPQAKPEPQGPEFSTECCADCKTPLLKDAAFCHLCGLPAKGPMAPATAMPAEVKAAPQPAQAPSPRLVLPTQQVPLVQPVQPVMASPFAGRGQCQPIQGPFGRVAAAASPCCDTSANRPQSGFGKVAMTCVYMGLFLGLFALIFSAPLVGVTFASTDLTETQAQNLVYLLHGVAWLAALFTVIGMVSGFFGLFHCNRRKSAAFWGLVLSALLFHGIGHGMQRLDTEIKARFPNVKVGSWCKQRGCGWQQQQQPPQQQQQITTPTQQQKPAPKDRQNTPQKKSPQPQQPPVQDPGSQTEF